MSEKVLGFKSPKIGDGKCALIFLDKRNVRSIKNRLQNNIVELPSIYSDQISFKQVPVVSVEELEKIIDEVECMHTIDKALEKENYSGEQEEIFEYGWTEAINAIKNQVAKK